MKSILLISGLLVLMASFPAYADSIVRVQCEDEDTGAEVYLNDKFVGECPVDASAAEGTVQLRARKIVNGDYEKIFEKKLRVVDGVSQRVELVMSAPQMTAEAKKRKEAAEATAQLKAAEAGDIDAMKKMARRYDAGIGVKKDSKQAEIWHDNAEAATAQGVLRAANAGDIEAMENIAARYQAGLGTNKDLSQAAFWRKQAETAKRERFAKGEAIKGEKLAEEKAQAKKDKISAISFSENTSNLVGSAEKNFIHGNPISITITGFPIMLLGIATDVIAAPTKSTQLYQIQNEAALRPSTWGKPDSMIAQASLQYEASISTTENPLLVAAAK